MLSSEIVKISEKGIVHVFMKMKGTCPRASINVKTRFILYKGETGFLLLEEIIFKSLLFLLHSFRVSTVSWCYLFVPRDQKMCSMSFGLVQKIRINICKKSDRVIVSSFPDP